MVYQDYHIEDQRRLIFANICNRTALFFSLALIVFIFASALISGAQELGGGLAGVIRSGPSALPWLFLLFFVGIAWRWELTGGTIILTIGIVLMYFFIQSDANIINAGLMLLVIAIGLLFLLSWYIRWS